MKNHLPLCLLILFKLACGSSLQAQERFDLLLDGRDPDSVFIYDSTARTFVGTNGMVVHYGPSRLTADRISGSEITGNITADGQVMLQRGTNFWVSEHLEYNYLTDEIAAEKFKTGQKPVYAAGSSLQSLGTNRVYQATDAYVTTDDRAEPGHRIRASEMKIAPGDYIEAKNATVLLGDVPIFYFPYFKRSLKGRANRFNVVPGYRSKYGLYFLGSYTWYWGDSVDGELHADWRSERGFGYGPDVNYDAGRFGQGHVGGYYARDKDPDTVDETGEPIDPDRYQIEFSHHVTLATNLTGKVVFSKQSDADFTKDFFEGKYRRNPQPRSFLELNQTWPNFSLSLLAHPQVDTFFETVERLPDIKLSALRQQLGRSPLYYEGESSVGYFHRRFADATNNDFAAFRADTFHQILYPHTFLGWLNVTPHVGGRFTYYGEAHNNGATTDEAERGVLNTGVEVSFKASRLWRDVKSDFWELNGLRHIVRPIFNYVYIPDPTERPPDLPQFDYQTEMLRLPPILFPDFNSIDSIDSQNVLRLGLWNTLQTKRHEEIDNILLWGIYTDWRIDPQRDQSTFSDLYSDLEWKPFSWLALTSEIRYGVEAGAIRIADHRATITPNNVWSLSLGHRYIREEPDNPLFELGDDIYSGSLYYRINENWGTRVALHYQAEDGLLQEQYYTLYRDLRSWTAALTFRVRKDVDAPTDYGVAFTFSLKSFPQFGLGDDLHRPELLLGD